MRTKVFLGVMLTLLLASMLTFTFNIQSAKAQPTTIIVPDDYPTLQEAINAASSGDTIFVRAGTYYEPIVVNKTVSLVGQSRTTTIIHETIRITANNVTITHFTIQNAPYSGILILSADWCTIQENTITGSHTCAVELGTGHHNTIRQNIMTNNSFCGVGLVDGSYNVIEDNIINDNDDAGIVIMMGHSNLIQRNNVENNGWNGDLVFTGIYVAYSSNNLIFNNNFINNLNQTWCDGSSNTWDDGYPSGGNYWSDYGERYHDAKEIDESGIWDTPYVIDENNTDFYPLINPWTPTTDFSIAASPTSLTIQQGSSDTSVITVTSIGSFNQPVQLAVSGAPSGVTATLVPDVVTPPPDGASTSTLTVSVDATTTPGSYTLAVTGTNGTLTHSADIPLEITPAPAIRYVIPTAIINVRSYPGIPENDANVITKLPKDSVLQIVEHPDNGKFVDGYHWWYVKFGIVKGWVAEEYVKEYDFQKQQPKTLNDVSLTAYHVCYEGEMAEGPTVIDPPKISGTFYKKFLYSAKGVVMQGSGRAIDGRVIKYVSGGGGWVNQEGQRTYLRSDGTWSNGPPYWIANEESVIFEELPEDTYKGAYWDVYPWYSIATDPTVIPPGTIVYIKELDGLRLSNGETLNGYFVVADTGGGIEGKRIDVFVGAGETALLDWPGNFKANIKYDDGTDWNRIQAKLDSPGELRVYDSQGNVTGVVNGEIKIEIPQSSYDYVDNAVTIVFPTDSYRSLIVGTGEGLYGLTVTSVSEQEVITFSAIDIPTSLGTIHQYTVDWDALSLGEEGVTVQVDSNGDGMFEHIFTSDSELSQSEYVIGTDNTPPTTILSIGEPKFVVEVIYVTPDTPFMLAADDEAGSGVYSTAYRISNGTYDSGWLPYTAPFYLTALTDGVYTIEFNSTDNVGNMETTNSIQVTLFSWNYVFTDSYGRDTTLKINTAHKFFQFITPDKDYGIKNATYMQVRSRTIIIYHEDNELKLVTLAIDTKLNFCITYAKDMQTGKKYWLIDKAGIE